MKHTSDVVVIGAGVLGSSIALELSRTGRDVLVIDKARGVGHGSTSASSAMVRFNYSTWSGIAAAWESLQCWLDWSGHLAASVGPDLAAFTRIGALVIDRGPESSKGYTPLFDRAGIPWERWDAETIRARLPYLETGSFYPPKPVTSDAFFDPPVGTITGLFTPDGGYVNDPQLAAQNLATAAQAHHTRFLLNREVTSISTARSGSWTVTTSGGDSVHAGVVVNAAGPWSSAINRLAGTAGDFAVAARPMRQEVHEVAAPAGYASGDVSAIAIADLDLGVYLRPSGAANLLIGGTEPECDPLEWVEDPDRVDVRPTATQFEAQVLRAARRLPGLHVPNKPTGLAGVYDVTDDWAPIYDRTAADNFYVAMGTSGNQFKNAPVIGLVMRRLIDEIEGGRDHDRDPVRVELPRTGNVVDLSAYSRRREVDASAPSSVLG